MIQSISIKSNSQRLVFNYPQNIVVEGLQRQIANAFNLFMNYKHYHWQTFGPLFRDLNIIFDEFATEVYNTVEKLSERVRSMGQNRIKVREFSKNASVKPSVVKNDVRRMIEEADKNAQKVIQELQDAIHTSELMDPSSANLLKDLLKIQEKHQWWLHYILDKRQGLITD